jgi:hypothetical protein
MAYLLDTSAVNRICDGATRPNAWSPLYITDLVLLELGRTRDTDRRKKLMAVLDGRLGPGCVLRSDGPGHTWHHNQVDDFDIPYDASTFPLGRPFPLIMRSIGISHRQHWRDAFIVQAAMMHGLTLVTADDAQAKSARRCGVRVEFIN